MKNLARTLVLGCSIVMTSAAIAQQSGRTAIPQELLDLDFQRCMNDCVPGFGAETCTPLCSCTVGEFKKRLDFSAYLDLSAQLARNEIDPANRALLDDVANYCTAELDKAGIKVGGPEQ